MTYEMLVNEKSGMYDVQSIPKTKKGPQPARTSATCCVPNGEGESWFARSIHVVRPARMVIELKALQDVEC